MVESTDMPDMEVPTETTYYQGSSMTTTTGGSWKKYCCNLPYILELIMCICVALFGYSIPQYVFRISLHERNIPYQATDNGDILLSLYLNNPYVGETIPNWLNFILAMLLPFLVIIFVAGIMSSVKYDLHAASCAYLFAMGCTSFTTELVKLYCGYLRPNFYGYCEFDSDSLQCESSHADDPRKSFPSGHASSSLCGTTMLTLVLLGKIGLQRVSMREVGSDSFYFLKKRLFSMLSALPIFLGIFIAASRVHDDMHHPADVVGGSVIGIGCAIFAHGLWYSSVYSQGAGYPIQTLAMEQQQLDLSEQ